MFLQLCADEELDLSEDIGGGGGGGGQGDSPLSKLFATAIPSQGSPDAQTADDHGASTTRADPVSGGDEPTEQADSPNAAVTEVQSDALRRDVTGQPIEKKDVDSMESSTSASSPVSRRSS